MKAWGLMQKRLQIATAVDEDVHMPPVVVEMSRAELFIFQFPEYPAVVAVGK